MDLGKRHVRVAIVGSGFGGLGMAIRLSQEGERDFLVFERAAEIGGVWRDNTYPGCACDVESHLYSFSFARNPSWTRAYSPQREILAYLKQCAERFGIEPHLRLGHAIESATWDAQLARWRLVTSQGEYSADVLVGAVGALSEPKLPNMPGLDSFGGTQFHSARWNHDHALAGKRVAVIGTGASAIQFVPAIQPTVAAMTVFQRTPPWILPRRDRAISERTQQVLARSQLAQRAVRGGIYAYRELFALAFLQPRAAKLGERAARKWLASQVRDPALREKLTPQYTMGCKRVLVSDDYLAALARDNVTVETGGIERVVAQGVVTRDGTLHEVDTIIYGTGFQVQDYPFAHAIRGREGRTLHESWNGAMTAHVGTTFAGFPNLFVLQGPNTGLGHSSVILMIESQIEHVLGALRHMARRSLATVEPRPAAQAAWNADVDARMRGTVWTTGGCDSWYLDANGRNSTLWPGFTFTFGKLVEPFRAAEYTTTARLDTPIRLTPQQQLKARIATALAALPDRAKRALAGPPIVVDGQTLAPEMQLVLRTLTKAEALTAESPGKLRQQQRIAAAVAAGSLVEVGPVRELSVDNLRARHYAPLPSHDAARPPLLVFFHGGGFVFGDLDTHDRVCRMLCRHAGVHVLSVEYSLAPERAFPAGVDDADRAWRWARRHAASLGADPTRIAIGGDSAGGNLSTVIAQRFARTADAPTCQLLIYPAVDHQAETRSKELFADGFLLTREAMTWFLEQYVDTVGAEHGDLRLRPFGATDLANQPPAIVITAGFDPLRDEAEAYAALLRHHGSTAIVRRFGSLIHGFANLTGISRDASDAMIEIAGMLRTMLDVQLAPRAVSNPTTRSSRKRTREHRA